MFTGFYIEEELGNNALSYKYRGDNPKLYVPELVSGAFEDAKIGNNIVFEDFAFEDGKMTSCKGLDKYLRIKWKDKDIILVDNHNVVLYFWYEARNKGLIGDDAHLIHIDEHSDLGKNDNVLSKEDSKDMAKVFDFTNYKCNVGNYILPAKEEGIVGEIHQIRSESALLDYKDKEISGDMILNIDLDFWNPNLDFISYDLKKDVVLKYAEKAKIITVSTSPFFIDQELAIKVFKNLLLKDEITRSL